MARNPLDLMASKIPWARKAEVWAADMITDAAVLAEAAKLPEFRACEWPGEFFGDARPQFFVAVCADGARFLIDTQGYDYARYIARLPRNQSAE